MVSKQCLYNVCKRLYPKNTDFLNLDEYFSSLSSFSYPFKIMINSRFKDGFLFTKFD